VVTAYAAVAEVDAFYLFFCLFISPGRCVTADTAVAEVYAAFVRDGVAVVVVPAKGGSQRARLDKGLEEA